MIESCSPAERSTTLQRCRSMTIIPLHNGTKWSCNRVTIPLSNGRSGMSEWLTGLADLADLIRRSYPPHKKKLPCTAVSCLFCCCANIVHTVRSIRDYIALVSAGAFRIWVCWLILSSRHLMVVRRRRCIRRSLFVL